MTDESASIRHPSVRGSLTDYYQPGRWNTYRTLDPVKAAALTAAVALIGSQGPDASFQTRAEAGGSVLAMAKEFEQYLTGEEANGPS